MIRKTTKNNSEDNNYNDDKNMEGDEDDDDDSRTTLGESSFNLLGPTPPPSPPKIAESPATQTLNTLSQSHEPSSNPVCHLTHKSKKSSTYHSPCDTISVPRNASPLSSPTGDSGVPTSRIESTNDTGAVVPLLSSGQRHPCNVSENEKTLSLSMRMDQYVKAFKAVYPGNYSLHTVQLPDDGTLGMTIVTSVMECTEQSTIQITAASELNTFCRVTQVTGQSQLAGLKPRDIILMANHSVPISSCSDMKHVGMEPRPLKLHVLRLDPSTKTQHGAQKSPFLPAPLDQMSSSNQDIHSITESDQDRSLNTLQGRASCSAQDDSDISKTQLSSKKSALTTKLQPQPVVLKEAVPVAVVDDNDENDDNTQSSSFQGMESTQLLFESDESDKERALDGDQVEQSISLDSIHEDAPMESTQMLLSVNSDQNDDASVSVQEPKDKPEFDDTCLKVGHIESTQALLASDHSIKHDDDDDDDETVLDHEAHTTVKGMPILKCSHCTYGEGVHHVLCSKSTSFQQERVALVMQGCDYGCDHCKHVYRVGTDPSLKQHNQMCPSQHDLERLSSMKTLPKVSTWNGIMESTSTTQHQSTKSPELDAPIVSPLQSTPVLVDETPAAERHVMLDVNDIDNIPVLYCNLCTSGQGEEHHIRCPKRSTLDRERFIRLIQGYNFNCAHCKHEYRVGKARPGSHPSKCPTRKNECSTKLTSSLTESKKNNESLYVRRSIRKVTEESVLQGAPPPSAKVETTMTISRMPEKLSDSDYALPTLFCLACKNDKIKKHHNRCPMSPDFDQDRYSVMVDGYNKGCRGCKDIYRYGLSKHKHVGCSRARLLAPTASVETKLPEVEAPPHQSQISLMDSTVEAEAPEVLVPFCAACQTQAKCHHELCPHHPYFESSGAKRTLEWILAGVQAKCASCTHQYLYGRKKGRHDVFCPRTLRKGGHPPPQSITDSFSQSILTLAVGKSSRKRSSVTRWTESQPVSEFSQEEQVSTKIGMEAELQTVDQGLQKTHTSKHQKMERGARIGCRACQYEMKRNSPSGTLRHADFCERSKNFRPSQSVELDSQIDSGSPQSKFETSLGLRGRRTKRQKMERGVRIGCPSCTYEMERNKICTVFCHDKKCERSRMFMPSTEMYVHNSPVSLLEVGTPKEESEPEQGLERHRSKRQKMERGVRIGCRSCDFEMKTNKICKRFNHDPKCERSQHFSSSPESNTESPDTSHGDPEPIHGLKTYKNKNQKIEDGVHVGCQSCKYESETNKKCHHIQHSISCERRRTITSTKGLKSLSNHDSPIQSYLQPVATKRRRLREGRFAKHRRKWQQGNKSELSITEVTVPAGASVVSEQSRLSKESAKFSQSASKPRTDMSTSRNRSVTPRTAPRNHSCDHVLESQSQSSEDDCSVQFTTEKRNEALTNSQEYSTHSISPHDSVSIASPTNSAKENKCNRGMALPTKGIKRKEINTMSRPTLEKAIQCTQVVTDGKDSHQLNSAVIDTMVEAKKRFLDETVDICSVQVPFCRACSDATKQLDIHHALCPKHPHFKASGALEKLQRIRVGVKNSCAACTSQFDRGSLGKEKIMHSDQCQGIEMERRKKEKQRINSAAGLDHRPRTTPGQESHIRGVNSNHITTPHEHTIKNDGKKVRLESDIEICRPLWAPCQNPWGPLGYHEGDAVVSSEGGFSHFEAFLTGKRFTFDPFVANSGYNETHYSPGDGTHMLLLSRDPMSDTPWGFAIEHHDFGGACLVKGIDPNSPAVAAKFVGSSAPSPLCVHDMILAVNGKPVGGKTEVGVELEIETSGVEVTLTVSRYRFPSQIERILADFENEAWENLQLSLQDKKNLGWCELDLGTDKVGIDSQRFLRSHDIATATQIKPDSLEISQDDNSIAQIELKAATGEVCDLEAPEDVMTGETSDEESQEETITSACVEVPKFHSETQGEMVDGSLSVSSNKETWENDDNPWNGCVCGNIHDPPATVFWIQCEVCDAWYNVATDCVGFDEETASRMNKWTCRACPSDDDS